MLTPQSWLLVSCLSDTNKQEWSWVQACLRPCHFCPRCSPPLPFQADLLTNSDSPTLTRTQGPSLLLVLLPSKDDDSLTNTNTGTLPLASQLLRPKTTTRPRLWR